jgi:hypothetical protein
MEVAGSPGQLIVREPDLWEESQHGYPQLFMATQIPPPRSLVNFNLSGFPDFMAQFSQRLSKFQDWREPRENPQIEGVSPLQIMGPPETSHPL